MNKIRVVAAAISIVGTLAFVAAAQATGFTQSSVTAPADGSLFSQNAATNPNQTFTVSGTTNGTSGEDFDIDCYDGSTRWHSYAGPGNSGIALTSTDGSFSVTNVPQSVFGGGGNSGICHLVVVPHGYSGPLGTGYTGPVVAFSELSIATISTGPNMGDAYDYYFGDATPTGGAQTNSIDDCGPFELAADGTATSNLGPDLFDCAGTFYNSSADLGGASPDLARADIEVDGQNAYGSTSAEELFVGSDQLPGFPALTATLDSFNTANGDAQTTESEPLVKCTPSDKYNPTSSDCTAFASTGVGIKRVTRYADSGRVATVTDTFSSTDGTAHSIDIQYDDDLLGVDSSTPTAGWEFPGQASFIPISSGSAPSASSAPATIYAIDNTTAAPGLTNPVGALTYWAPYKSAGFDDTLWLGENSGLFDYQDLVPAGGSMSITWSYATGTSLSEVQGYAASAEDAMQPLAIAIGGPSVSPSSPVTVYGTASAGSGIKSVTVDGVSATVSGDNWRASGVPITKVDARNIITATLTSQAGNTATATRNVSYTPPSKVKLDHTSFNGTAVLVKVQCEAIGGACRGSIRDLRTVQTVIKHHKKKLTTSFLASKKRYSLNSGRAATVRVALNAVGRRLLKAHGTLLVKGLVTVTQRGGQTLPVASFKLNLKQRVTKHK